MTREERNTKLKHFITCLKCEVSGKECDDNCPVQYEAGNMGEIIENLEAISKALEQEPCEDAMSRILKRMWNCRGKHTTSIDKVNMEQILRDELPSVNPQPKTGCEGCIYEKTGNNSKYPCSHCGRCYTDKYKAEVEPQERSEKE